MRAFFPGKGEGGGLLRVKRIRITVGNPGKLP